MLANTIKEYVVFRVFCLIILLIAVNSLHADESVVLYSGRKKQLVEPLLKKFESKTGIDVKVKYGKTAQLAMIVREEGGNSLADVFWGQDAGAMGLLSSLFISLPKSITSIVPEEFRARDGRWTPVSGRARVIAYAPDRVKMLPKSIFALTKPEYKGRVGWAPTNASFQAFITAMRVSKGEENTESWLKAMVNNGAKVYPKNTPIIQALAAGEIDLGLPNHYYLLRFLKKDKDFPVKQTFFADGDIGNLVNVAGVGIFARSKKQQTALKLVEYLLSEEAQQFFVSETFEYPLRKGVKPASKLASNQELKKASPKVNLSEITDLNGTLKLLRKVGLL
ncbi:MAG: iron ABC transporter substrate-binding protein [Planctomycetota bacterium]|jgi:iron(III) transport system substrate-binding protein